MEEAGLAEQVTAMRHFNRFYTQKIGVLEEGLLQSPFSLTELRVLYELVHRDRPTASELGRALGLDAGYLSRILARFEQQGLIVRTPSPQDGRQTLLAVTEAGVAAMAPLEERSNEVLGRLLQPLSPGDRAQLVDAFRTVERLLGEPRDKPVSYLLRPHRPGDLGWIVHRHGALYAREYGWGDGFEGLVAEIAAQFLRQHDPRREQCWVAELDGEIVGSVMLVRQSDEIAKLRLLLVEPKARSHGIGARLVEECLRFARQAGYRRMTLWTNDVLTAARRVYERAGFRLVDSRPHREFGPEMVGETWEREL